MTFLKIFETILIFFATIQIALSPILLGLIVAVIIYFNTQGIVGLTISILTTLIGLIIGIIWAIRIQKKQNPIDFLSKIRHNPEFDKKEENE